MSLISNDELPIDFSFEFVFVFFMKFHFPSAYWQAYGQHVQKKKVFFSKYWKPMIIHHRKQNCMEKFASVANKIFYWENLHTKIESTHTVIFT